MAPALYACGLAAHVGKVICADPSQAVLNHLPKDDALLPMQASAEYIAFGKDRHLRIVRDRSFSELASFFEGKEYDVGERESNVDFWNESCG